MQTIEQSAPLFAGRLMSPGEVRQVTANQALSEAVRSRWYLCGEVPAALWNRLQSADNRAIGHRLSAFTTNNDTAYAIFTVQVDDAQIRFLYPLADSRASAFLNDAGTNGFWFSLSPKDGQLATLTSFQVSPKEILPLIDIAKVSRRLPPLDTLLEFQLALQESMRRNTVPSVFIDTPIQHVTLNVVLPKRTAAMSWHEEETATTNDIEGNNDGNV